MLLVVITAVSNLFAKMGAKSTTPKPITVDSNEYDGNGNDEKISTNVDVHPDIHILEIHRPTLIGGVVGLFVFVCGIYVCYRLYRRWLRKRQIELIRENRLMNNMTMKALEEGPVESLPGPRTTRSGHVF